ncbi:DUF4245 domain-containing protein [Streptomyces sp. LX-29]|uniref:DUF4245 domain-containing protein n=1 Tax=Streptomyces sp. LX-29 TaxID=2900152 RepID=UPI00240E2C72|nr:DUF4245 domain-containing protein [Streptomyces sp. LX-29]WFB07630.1 DUF4245 domain-containing protein [Streptomyces sp. LX-29]
MAGMRGKQSVRNMVLSLSVSSLAAAGIYVFGVPHDENNDPIKTVDYEVDLKTVRRAASYPVAAPKDGALPKGWRATSVRYTPQSDVGAVWHLGFLDPDREYVAIEQSDGRPGPFVDEVTQSARKTEKTEKIAGETWQRYEGPKYDALVREGKGVTTVVTGTASFAQLTKMAAALDARKG